MKMINKTKASIFVTATMGSLLSSIVGQAADVTVSSSAPMLKFDDLANTNGTTNDWIVTGTEPNFMLFDMQEGTNIVYQYSHSINNTNSLIVDTSGDINLANGSVFIDRSEKR